MLHCGAERSRLGWRRRPFIVPDDGSWSCRSPIGYRAKCGAARWRCWRSPVRAVHRLRNVSAVMARGRRGGEIGLIRSALSASRCGCSFSVSRSTLLSLGGILGLLVLMARRSVSEPSYRTDSVFVPFAVSRGTIPRRSPALAFAAVVTISSALIFSAAPALRRPQAHARRASRRGRTTTNQPQQELRSWWSRRWRWRSSCSLAQD